MVPSVSTQKLIEAAPSESAKEFLKDQMTETQPGSPGAQPEVLNPLAAAPDSPPQPAKPIFEDLLPAETTAGATVGGAGSADNPVKPLPTSDAARKMKFILAMVDKMQAKGFAKIAREMDIQRWRFDEEEMVMLMDAWEPYMKEHGGGIPDWIVAAITTLWILGNRAIDAISLRKQNMRNEALQDSPQVQRAVADAAAGSGGKRKNYTLALTVPGYYQCDAKSGIYLSKEKILRSGTKASFEDIQLILKENDLETVRLAFPGMKLPHAAA